MSANRFARPSVRQIIKTSLLALPVWIAVSIAAASTADISNTLLARLEEQDKIEVAFREFCASIKAGERKRMAEEMEQFSVRFSKNAISVLNFYIANKNVFPEKLKEVVRLSASGSKDYASGSAMVVRALNEGNQDLNNQGWELIERGGQQTMEAAAEFNQFVGEHNKLVKGERKGSEDESVFRTFERPLEKVLLPFLKYAVSIFAYLVIASMVLNWSFKAKLKRLLSNPASAKGFGGTGAYGAHLMLVFPFVYFALIGSIILVIYFGFVLLHLVLSLPRVPIALLIGTPLVVIFTIVAILKGIFGSKKIHNFGEEATRQDQPELWKICDEVAKAVGTKPLTRIYLSPEPGIGVHQEGTLFGVLLGRTKRVLTIGVPSIAGLTQGQMQAILAHEFGHFSNRDTAWNSFTFTVASAIGNTLQQIPKPGDAEGYMAIITFLNPALWVIVACNFLFRHLTSGFSRMREVMADKTAISIFGAKDFVEGLKRVVKNDHLFARYFMPEMAKMLKENDQVYVNVFDTAETTYAEMEQEKLERLEKEAFGGSESSMDSHPPVKDRFAYAASFEQSGHRPGDSRPFKETIVNYPIHAKKLSDLCTAYVAHLTGYTFKDETPAAV